MLAEHPMKDRCTRVTAPAGFDGQATRRDYYFKTTNAAREFSLRINRDGARGTWAKRAGFCCMRDFAGLLSASV